MFCNTHLMFCNFPFTLTDESVLNDILLDSYFFSSYFKVQYPSKLLDKL